MKGSPWSWPKRISIDHNKGYLSIPGFRKYPCKKLKGKHDFQIVFARRYDWWPEYGISIYLECSGCGKKKYDYYIDDPDAKKKI